MSKLDISSATYYEELSSLKKKELTNMLKEMTFTVTSYKGFDFAQVCSGGVSLEEINPLNMQSLKEEGLYLTGEILDVNGDCGGYNLTFAFISGMLAGRDIK